MYSFSPSLFDKNILKHTVCLRVYIMIIPYVEESSQRVDDSLENCRMPWGGEGGFYKTKILHYIK